MHTRDHALLAPIDLLINRHTNASHDPHTDDHIWRVGQLNTDLRDRRLDRSHAKRKDIHRTAGHTPFKKPFEGFLHLERSHPIIGGPAAYFESEQIKVRSSTRATSVASERA